VYKLFLDDLRDPEWVHGGDASGWLVCRTVAEARAAIGSLGWPSVVSFDHDLGLGQPTGMDLARWLVEHDLDTGSMPRGFTYVVHSANPVGAANIRGLMEGYLAQRS
jgi:hypothetical protein